MKYRVRVRVHGRGISDRHDREEIVEAGSYSHAIRQAEARARIAYPKLRVEIDAVEKINERGEP